MVGVLFYICSLRSYGSERCLHVDLTLRRRLCEMVYLRKASCLISSRFLVVVAVVSARFVVRGKINPHFRPPKAADTLMQLGLLWNSWDQPRRSLLYLLASVAFLGEASSSPALIPGVESPSEDEIEPAKSALVDPVPTLAGLTLERNDPEAKAETSKLEILLTHAYFYLAQVRYRSVML